MPATPYQPFQPLISPLRGLYSSVCQVQRLTPSMTDHGTMAVAWQPVTDIVDVIQDQPGMLACRLAVGRLRPGKDQLPPFVAGRPQDRVAVLYFDPVTDINGTLLVKAGDRLLCVSGPISGSWELRNIPDQLQGYNGAAHCEVQVIEVAAQTAPGSPAPFPGGRP